MPCDLGDCSLDLVGVLEDHDRLRRNWLTCQLWLLVGEVLLEEIQLVVLLDAASCTRDEVFGGSSITESRLLVESPHVLLNFGRFSVIDVGGPTPDLVGHPTVLRWDSIGVHLYLNFELDIINHNLLCARTSAGCCQSRSCLGSSEHTALPRFTCLHSQNQQYESQCPRRWKYHVFRTFASLFDIRTPQP